MLVFGGLILPTPLYLTEFIQIPDFWTQILSLIFVPQKILPNDPWGDS